MVEQLPAVQIPEKGSVIGLPFEIYLSTQAISSHAIKEILTSPAHYQASLIEERKETESFARGGRLHKAILEPHLYLGSCTVMPEFTGKTKDGKESNRSAEALEKKKIWIQEAEAKKQIIVTAEEQTQVQGMVKAIADHPFASKLLQGGVSELSLFWKDEKTNLPCKARLDYLRYTSTVVEYKTTKKASARAFRNDAWKYGYAIQASNYQEAVREVFGQVPDRIVFVAQEPEPPYAVQVYLASKRFLDLGERARRRGLDLFALCQETSNWPAYPNEILELDAPPWAEEELEYGE